MDVLVAELLLYVKMAAAMGIVVAEASLMLQKYQRRRSLLLINRGKKRAPRFLVHQNKNKAKKIKKKNTPGSVLRYCVGEDNSACVFSCLRSRRKSAFISTVKPTQRAFVRFAVKLEIFRFLLPYLNYLSNMGEFASGIAAYSFLIQEMRKCVGTGENRKKYLDGCTFGLMVFEFNPTSQELYLLNPDSSVAAIVRAKDQEIKKLKKGVAELEAAANKDLCVVAPAKADAAATKKQRDRGAACEEQGDNDGEEKERKYEEEKDEEDEEMDEERKDDENEEEEEEEKAEQDKQNEEKIKEGQDDKKGEKEDGEDEEGKEKEGEKEEERKDGDDDEERDHDADNEHNDMNKENQTKHCAGQVSCHHEVEMNKKLEAISWKLDFGQDVDFGERDYEAVRTLSSIVDDLDSPLSTTPAQRAKQRNEESDHGEKKKTILEQGKAGPPKKKWSDLKLNVKAFEKYN
ncbi:hypothetical protein CDL12_13417 [Handroanthus impetiginosus]|uniref:Ubiquitinyl hydrolase 1 n=1 Tax=Handroanthus impetiginosus TaxID=429701 RepID=A0A2G9H8X0_9LAMI|nr:hypothetical protein CDL12_13417 [Handroanthus impetiginosus]